MICTNLGEVMLNSTDKAVLKSKHQEKTLKENDNEFDVYLEFYDDQTKLNIPRYYFPSFADANSSWFKLEISYVNSEIIYVSDSGGHEGYPSHFVFDNKKWSKFIPWEFVKAVFPDNIQPPFSLLASEHRLKITEENYCCDQVYSDKSKRIAFRMVYILDRRSGRIIETSNVLR